MSSVKSTNKKIENLITNNDSIEKIVYNGDHKKATLTLKDDSKVTLDVMHYCFMCNNVTSKKCGSCRNTFYCSIECQRKDWPEHKKYCAIENLCRIPEIEANIIDNILQKHLRPTISLMYNKLKKNHIVIDINSDYKIGSMCNISSLSSSELKSIDDSKDDYKKKIFKFIYTNKKCNWHWCICIMNSSHFKELESFGEKIYITFIRVKVRNFDLYFYSNK
jgi:hypothetical protein